MNPIIIADPSALFSLLVKTDQNYSRALKISKQLLRKRGTIVIPGEIFAEIINILGKKVSKSTAIKAAKEFLASKVFMISETTPANRLLALKKFQKQPRSVSFTDCLVMAFADEFETKNIFGFDETFKKNGYIRLGVDKEPGKKQILEEL